MDQDLTLGEVINGTIATVAENKEVALIFVAVLTVLGTSLEWGLGQWGRGLIEDVAGAEWLLTWFGIGAGIGGLAFLIVAVVGQYMLWEIMLRRYHHLGARYDRRFLGFVGLSILTALGVGFGFLLLIIPGLIFSARWAMAPAFLIVERKGILESMGGSWDGVKGNTTPVVLAILIAAFAVLAVNMGLGLNAFVAANSGDVAPFGLAYSLIGQLLSQMVTVLQAGLGVFLFGRLHGASETLSGVFE